MLVLASASPRRKELLAQAGYLFETMASSVPEDLRPQEDPVAFATRLAREKAIAVYSSRTATLNVNPSRESSQRAGNVGDSDPLIVLGADTVVVAPNREILGKPANASDAARMLRLLAGGTHQVITGVCAVSEVGADAAAEITSVAMRTMSDEEIRTYVATGEPMDKAGAYAIQGYAARWIPRIQGCYFNVVGLPLALVASLLEGMQAKLRSAVPAEPVAK
jgi:nucleoside triphosphate pyrophosphatase